MSDSTIHPIFAGICGPSGCGKSTLARGVRNLLGQERCGIVSLDAFYKDLSALPEEERNAVNFDRPDALDAECLRDVLGRLAISETVELPVYDFATHTRKTETVRFEPHPLILIEGVFAFSFPWLVEGMSTRIYLHLDPETCLAWRLARDAEERARSEAEIRARFERDVLPSIEKWVDPQRKFATRVLDANAAQSILVKETLREIGRIPGVHSRIVPARPS